jgi:N-acetylneuraminic acid mutarotase
MSKSAALLLVLVFTAASCAVVAKPALSSGDATEDSWEPKTPMQVARSGLGAAVVNGRIYAIGGSTENGVVSINEEYDPATNTWTTKAPMLIPLSNFGIAVYNNKIYCIGGPNGTNEVYDPATNTWASKAPMPTAKYYGAQANVVNGKIYIIGGYPAYNRMLNEVYDPATDTWTTKAPMPVGAGSSASGGNYASAAVDNKIYVVGEISSDGKHNLNQIYDTATDSWSYGASPPTLIYGTYFGLSTAVATTGEMAPKRIYVISAASNSNQVYDPKTDRWTIGADMPTQREELGVAVLNDTLYAIGGLNYHFAYPDDTFGVSVTYYAANEHYTPVSYGTPVPSYDGTAPEIAVVSPENKTYHTTDVELNFIVNEPVSSICYELDGETVCGVSGNMTLSGLSYGAHNVTVYATDVAGNTGASETISFNVAEETESFSTAFVVAASGVLAVIIGLGLLVYFMERKH